MPCFAPPSLSKFPPRAGTSHRLESLHQLLQRVLMLLLVMAGLLLAPRAQALGTITGLRVQNGVVTVQFADNPGVYYLLEYSPDLIQWGPADMSLGIDSILDLETGVTKGFFRAIPYSKYSPLDSDGDGIDDVYELNHAELDPLDPTDGSKLAPGGGGRTNYQVYLSLFGISSYKLLQRESREVSVFNFGSGNPFEAITREQSVFNFGSPSASVEANSREISLYNGQAVPVSDLLQRESREWSVFNFGSAPGSGTSPGSVMGYTISKEISVFNGQAVPVSDLLQRESREWSVFNFGSPSATLEAISREVSVLNFTEP